MLLFLSKKHVICWKYILINLVLKINSTRRSKIGRRRAFREYRIYSEHAADKRPAWLDGLADAIAAKGDLSRSTAVRQLKSQEESRHTHRLIRIETKDFVGAPLHMELEHGNGPYISTDKDEIEDDLMVEYENKYRLAEASPFLKEPLLSDFGQLALTANSQAVLDGTYQCPPGIDEYTKTFIRHLQKSDAIKTLPYNDIQITTP